MKLLAVSLLMAIASPLWSAECPVQDTLAYSRETTSGIPGSQAPLQVSYFVYVVVKSGTVLPASAGVWVRGKYHAASLKKVSSPVEVAHDTAVPTGEVDTLVGRTADDVYQVEIGAESSRRPAGAAAKKRLQDHPVVVCLKVGQRACYAAAKEIKALQPAPGM